jgi:hypothetical protein
VEILQETQSKKKTKEILNLSKEDLNRIIKGMLDRLGCLSVRDIMAGRFGNKYGRRKSNEKAL